MSYTTAQRIDYMGRITRMCMPEMDVDDNFHLEILALIEAGEELPDGATFSFPGVDYSVGGNPDHHIWTCNYGEHAGTTIEVIRQGKGKGAHDIVRGTPGADRFGVIHLGWDLLDAFLCGMNRAMDYKL